jgi:electron transfer flavoprotein beta subunit
MNIIVLLKMVPDIVEELEVAPDGKSLDLEFLRLIVNERDEHALEQALLLKERFGGSVTALAIDAPEIDDVLYTALAKGADRAVKITGIQPELSTRSAAAAIVAALPTIPELMPADLILTGCQASDDLDGWLAPLIAGELGLPHVGIVTGIELADGTGAATVVKEFPGGAHGEFELPLPALIGIQAAEKPPRYVPVAKVRAAMGQEIETVATPAEGVPATVQVSHMKKPEAGSRAEILEGPLEAAIERLCGVLADHGLM